MGALLFSASNPLSAGSPWSVLPGPSELDLSPPNYNYCDISAGGTKRLSDQIIEF